MPDHLNLRPVLASPQFPRPATAEPAVELRCGVTRHLLAVTESLESALEFRLAARRFLQLSNETLQMHEFASTALQKTVLLLAIKLRTFSTSSSLV